MKTRVIKDSDSFLKIKSDWNDLLVDSESDTIFLTWEWIYNWWCHFNTNKRLFIIVAEENGSLIGVAPFYLTKAVFFGIRPLTHLEFLGTTQTASEYLDFIIKRGREKEVLENILDVIFRSNDFAWDVLNFVGINEESSNLKICSDYLKRNKIKNKVYEVRNLPYISFPDSLTAYLKTLSKDKQNRFLRYRRNLEKDFLVNFKIIDKVEELERIYECFVNMYRKRWKEKKEEGSFAKGRKDYEAFHLSVIKEFFNKGWLYFATLSINNKIVAAQYDFIYKDKIYYYSVTFDPQWSNYRVGSVLLLHIIEEGIRRKFTEIDFLRGEEEYKFHWAKSTKKTLDIAIWNSEYTYFMIRIEKSLRRLVKRILPVNISEKIFKTFFLRR